MAVTNSSTRDVEYEVRPSDPGLGTPILLSAALTLGGAAFTALGCLTEIGGEPLTLIGLFSLVAALVADVYAYSKVKTVGPVLLSGGGGGKTELGIGANSPQSFAAGTWVVFSNPEEPYEVLATSQPIFDSDATVTFRECTDPRGPSVQSGAVLMSTVGVGYHVDVT